MRITLVTYIPDNAVVGCIKNMMQRNGEFNHTKASTQMSPSHRDGVNQFGSEFISQLRELLIRQLP